MGIEERYDSRASLRNVFEWLDEVRRRPSMYIRNSSLRELDLLVWGYETALHVHGIDEGVPLLRPFSTWLRYRTGWSMSGGWAYAIERAEGVPLDRFFALLDEYRQLRVVTVSSVTLGPTHTPTGARAVIGFDKLMPPPSVIEIIEYQPAELVFLRFRYGGEIDEQDVYAKGTIRAGTVDDAKAWVADEFCVEPGLWRTVASQARSVALAGRS